MKIIFSGLLGGIIAFVSLFIISGFMEDDFMLIIFSTIILSAIICGCAKWIIISLSNKSE